MNLKNKKSELKELKKAYYQEIYDNNDAIKIWKKTEDGCYIGTLGYTEENIKILLKLLKSFEEQYNEVIDYEAAKEELELYQREGKLFIYFDQNMNPVSMNGCIYNYENDTVDFVNEDNKPMDSLYFYGLSTVPEYRGKGACRKLIDFALEFAKYNGMNYAYARTDLENSNSEWIMGKSGMEICKEEDMVISEWVKVKEEEVNGETKEIGDWRLHMWIPFEEGISVEAKGKHALAIDNGIADRQIVEYVEVKPKNVPLQKQMVYAPAYA